MLSEEVCMFVSNACRLHTWHHDVMLSHFLLYSVTELSRRWWHFILVELHKICLKEEERSGMVQFFTKTMYAFLTSAVVALFIPSNRWLDTVLLPFPIKKLECLYLWVYASTSATFIVITLSISMQTGMLDFSGTAQKVQLVQHQEHVFFQTFISNWWHYELFITKVHGLLLSCYSFCTVIR